MYFGSVEKPPRLAEFKMEIPDSCIAQNPPKNRVLEYLMHPDYLGNLIFFIGLFLLSVVLIQFLEFCLDYQNYYE